MTTLEIITTADGSHTLRNHDLNETYHSIHGAVQESLHVFIGNGLGYFYQQSRAKSIAILEIGFGTGLNSLLALQYAQQQHLSIHYTTLEPFPLTEAIWSNLNYGTLETDQRQFRQLHEADWDKEITIVPQFTLLKIRRPLHEVCFNEQYDIVFFDAFAPSVQPELWSRDALQAVVAPLSSGGIFVTYSAKGQLKRDLKLLGLAVETLPGPPGKNEMVRALKPGIANALSRAAG